MSKKRDDDLPLTTWMSAYIPIEIAWQEVVAPAVLGLAILIYTQLRE